MNWLGTFNLVEAAWRLFVAAVVAVRSRSAIPPQRRLGFMAAVCLIAFGISDGIEFFTGAWWRPLPLLMLKGSCLVGLAVIGICYLLQRKRNASCKSKAT